MLKIEVVNKPVSKEQRCKHKENQQMRSLLNGAETHADIVAYIHNLEKRIKMLEQQTK